MSSSRTPARTKMSRNRLDTPMATAGAPLSGAAVQETSELGRVRRDGGSVLVSDLIRAVEIGQGLIHGLHPLPSARLDDRVDLVRLVLADEAAHGGVDHEHLGRESAAPLIRALD